MQTIIVTGGCGFIGRHLVKFLSDLDLYSIWVIDDLSNGNPLPELKNVFHIKMSIQEAFKSPEYINNKFWAPLNVCAIYHLGEYSRIHPSFRDWDQVLVSNIVGTQAIVRYWKMLSELNPVSHRPKFIYAGSSTRFVGDNKNDSPYAFTKYMNAELIKNTGKWYDLNQNICYFYNVYGSESKGKLEGYQSVIDVFKEQMWQGKKLTVVSPGFQQRDFTYVGDVVDGLYKTLVYAPSNKELHLGSGQMYTIFDVAHLFNNHTDVQMILPRKGERQFSIADNQETKEILGWKPKMDLPTYIKCWLSENIYK